MKFVGLMGCDSDGTLISPSGKVLFKAPLWLSGKIQRVQHWIAQKTWR